MIESWEDGICHKGPADTDRENDLGRELCGDNYTNSIILVGRCTLAGEIYDRRVRGTNATGNVTTATMTAAITRQ